MPPIILRIRVPLGLVLLLSALLAGCGHRGPLYVPGKPGDPLYDREHRGERPQQTTSPQFYPPMQSNGVNDSRP